MRMKTDLRATALAFLTVLAFAVSAGEKPAEAFRLADATVVCEDALLGAGKGDSGRSWGREAVEVLTNVLTLVTGKPIPAVAESRFAGDGPAIYLGSTRAARAAGLDVSALPCQTFRLVVRPGAAYLAAPTGTAGLFGAVEFVRRFTDYRFLSFDAEANPYTVDPDAVATELDLTRSPAMADWRNSFWTGYRHTKPLGAWFRCIRATGHDVPDQVGRFRCSKLMNNCHSQFDYCPPEKHFKDHPEYYSLGADGKRHADRNRASQLCFTSEGAFQTCLKSMLDFIAEDRRRNPGNPPLLYDFSQMDNCLRLCQCPACLEMVRKFDRKGGYKDGGDAGLQLQFVNRLAREVAKRYPDVFIRTFAYVSTEQPPKDLKPEPNVVIWLCDLYTFSCHDLPLAHPFNAPRLKLLRDWRELTPHLELWDYTLYTDAFPEVFVDAVGADVALFREMGLESVYYENHYEGQPFYELNTYVQAECMYGADRTVDEIVDEWCRIYGKGAAKMRRAIDVLRAAERENPPSTPAAWHARSLSWRSAATWRAFLGFARGALADAADEPAVRRLKIAQAIESASRDLLRICRQDPEESARYEDVRAQYLKDAAAADRPRQKTDRLLLKLELRFRDLPPELKDVPLSHLYFVDERFFGGARADGRTQLVDDPETDSGHTLKVKDWLGGDAKSGFAGVLVGKDNDRYNFRVCPPDDGHQHWYKATTLSLPSACMCWFGALGFPLTDAYVLSDGLDYDPNLVDVWVSVRFRGSYSSPKDDEGFFSSRLILHRKAIPANN